MEKFSKSEKEVIVLLIKGCNNYQMSKILCCSPHTIKSKIAVIFDKTGAVNRTNLAYMIGYAESSGEFTFL